MGKRITFKDLIDIGLIYLFRILLAAVAGAVLCGLYGLYVHQSQSETASSGGTGNKRELKLAEAELDYYAASKEYYEVLINDSIYMNLNAGNLAKFETGILLLQENEADPEAGLLQSALIADAYASGLKADAVRTAVYAALGSDVAQWDYEYLISAVKTENSNVVTLTILAADLETAEKLTDAVLSELTGHITGLYGAHKASVLSSAGSYTLDESVRKRQNSVLDSYDKAASGYKSAKSDYNRLTNNASLEENNVKSLGVRLAKYAALGACAGLFCGYILCLILWVNRRRLFGTEDIRAHYNLNVLGTLDGGGVKKTGWRSRMLERLSGPDRRLPADTRLDILAATLRALADADRRFILTGSIGADRLEKTAERLADRLGSPVSCGGCILDDAQTSGRVKESGAVVLVEASGVTTYARFNEQLMKLELLDAEVLGVVLLD